MKKAVVIGLLGPTLDMGFGPTRWDKWRPTVDLCRHEDLLINRFELIYQGKFNKILDQVTDDIGSVSPETEVVPIEVPIEDPWDFEEVYGALLDYARSKAFEPETEDYLVHMTTGTHVAQICMFLLTESRHIPGRLIQASPPKGRVQMGPGNYTIIDLDLSKYDKLASRFRKESIDDISLLKSGIETRNADFNELIERIERVAINSTRPVLITGPTGAGKSQLARRIYELKHQRAQVTGRFVEVNCATLRGDMAMSALFGHVKGAFSGALTDRSGLLKEADRGLLFLDEVGDLGIDEQTMLLRALEEKSFLPLGSDNEAMSDFQLICGTNRDLSLAVKEGKFREDLLARINLWTFRLPGLSQRTEDIEPNLFYELEQYESQSGVHMTFNKEAFSKFLSFASSDEAEWSANFRDLNGAVTRMATLATGGRITEGDVDEEIERLMASWKGTHEESKFDLDLEVLLGADRIMDIDSFDQSQLAYVVKVCRESKTLSEAGRKLFSVSRTQKKNTNDADRLRKYLARFSLSWDNIH